MPSYWYALHSKSRKEEIVWKQVEAQGFKVFFPRLRVNPVNPRSRRLRPYFPGYLFVQVDLEAAGLSFFKWMPHTIGLVSFGGEPAIVPENLIEAIRKRLDEINSAGGEKFEAIKPGDKVWITHGPFSGYEAIFDARLPGKERVRVLLSLLSNKRQVPVELNIGYVEKTKSS